MADIRGRVAIVTGASAGIGEGLARMLAAQGARVALAARREAELERVAAEMRAAGGEALVVPTNMRDDEALQALVARTEAELGPVDILVNNAGVARNQPIHEVNMKRWDLVMDVNLRAPVRLASLVLPGMRERRRGWIVNIASEAGVFVFPGMGAYAASKHALRVVTELIEQENEGFGIKAWAICPGFVETDMVTEVPGDHAAFLKVEDVVELARFLFAQGDNVKMGPAILVRPLRDPFA